MRGKSCPLEKLCGYCDWPRYFLVSSGTLLDDLTCDGATHDEAKRCTRTKYAISIGAITAIISFIWVIASQFVDHGMRRGVDMVLTWIFIPLWTAGISVVTFGGEKAPAATWLGNLYFFTWGSFLLCLFMAIDEVKSRLQQRTEQVSDSSAVREDVEGGTPKVQVTSVDKFEDVKY